MRYLVKLDDLYTTSVKCLNSLYKGPIVRARGISCIRYFRITRFRIIGGREAAKIRMHRIRILQEYDKINSKSSVGKLILRAQRKN